MDKILSAEEWYYRQLSQQNGKTMTNWQIAQAYSTYLLEAFAGEVKNNAYIHQHSRDYKISIKAPIVRQKIMMSEIDKSSIDQLLTKFKEKL